MTLPMYRPPSKRRMQVEAWGIAATILAVAWCLIGGIWLGVELILTLARMALGV
jgi:hypothetical protein